METTLHQSGNILVTTARTVVGGTTYSAKHITSVEAVEYPPKTVGKTVLFVGGLFIALCGASALMGSGMAWLSENSQWPIALAFGLLMGVVGAGMLSLALFSVSPRPTYGVRISTATGEADILASPDERLVDNVVRAVTESITD